MAAREDKAELRSFVRLTRSARSSEQRSVAADNFTEFLGYLSDQFAWSRIAAFIPTNSEPPIARGIDTLVRAGVTVLVPESSEGGLLTWIELAPGSIDQTTRDSQSMPIPTEGRRVEPRQLDAVLVPAAAVDRDGKRLGWGKGYYDRFLESATGSPLVVAVVFNSDVVESVPVESHDAPVGAILTESEIFFTQ